MCQTAAAQVGTATTCGGFRFTGCSNVFSGPYSQFPRGWDSYLGQGPETQGCPGKPLEGPSKCWTLKVCPTYSLLEYCWPFSACLRLTSVMMTTPGPGCCRTSCCLAVSSRASGMWTCTCIERPPLPPSAPRLPTPPDPQFPAQRMLVPPCAQAPGSWTRY